MGALGFSLRNEAVLATLTEDVLKSSEIEGQILESPQVRSSIARRLGIDIGGVIPTEHHVEGVVEMMLDATQNYARPLTVERLFGWHAALFPTGRSGMSRIVVGAWRDGRSGPMQVVSGADGKEKIHFEAPVAGRLDGEMRAFLDWFESPLAIDPVLKAAVAHLWFVTVHPFEDGNGRIARAIADLALARSEGSPQRFYSMSAQIQRERRAYYDMLETTQRGHLDITPWLEWFLSCFTSAVGGAETVLAQALRKARFWEAQAGQKFNERQWKMLDLLLDGFHGKLTNAKWATLTKASPDTALRDLTNLVGRGILTKEAAGGRSTAYRLTESGRDLPILAPVRL